MYRGVGDTDTPLFTDPAYLASQERHAPIMLDPPKRTANAVAPESTPTDVMPSAPSSPVASAAMDSLVMFGLVGVVAVAGIYFFSRKG